MNTHYTPARELAARLRDGSMSCSELMSATLARIDACNPDLNAICTRVDDVQAMAMAAAMDKTLRSEGAPGPLAGLPMAVKDLSATAGMRTTMGSRIFAE
ncbi:MAG: amidase family protein, partial [Halieaceae bacterium]